MPVNRRVSFTRFPKAKQNGHRTHLTSSNTLSQILCHQTILKIAKPSTLLEMILRQEHIPYAEFLRSGLQILNNTGVTLKTTNDIGRVSFTGFFDLLMENCIGRDTFFLDEALDDVEGLLRAVTDEGAGDDWDPF